MKRRLPQTEFQIDGGFRLIVEETADGERVQRENDRAAADRSKAEEMQGALNLGQREN